MPERQCGMLDVIVHRLAAFEASNAAGDALSFSWKPLTLVRAPGAAPLTYRVARRWYGRK